MTQHLQDSQPRGDRREEDRSEVLLHFGASLSESYTSSELLSIVGSILAQPLMPTPTWGGCEALQSRFPSPLPNNLPSGCIRQANLFFSFYFIFVAHPEYL